MCGGAALSLALRLVTASPPGSAPPEAHRRLVYTGPPCSDAPRRRSLRRSEARVGPVAAAARAGAHQLLLLLGLPLLLLKVALALQHGVAVLLLRLLRDMKGGVSLLQWQGRAGARRLAQPPPGARPPTCCSSVWRSSAASTRSTRPYSTACWAVK